MGVFDGPSNTAKHHAKTKRELDELVAAQNGGCMIVLLLAPIMIPIALLRRRRAR